MYLGQIDSGDKELDGLISKWLEWNLEDSDDRKHVSKLVETGDFASLKKLMKPRKSFGTAGIRGRMGPG